MKPVTVGFYDIRLKKAYDSLKRSRGDDRELVRHLDCALDDLKANPFCGIQIPRRLIPKAYKKRFGDLDNLWKYDLPNAWRLIYTVVGTDVRILAMVLEWMSHKEYERRFGYKPG